MADFYSQRRASGMAMLGQGLSGIQQQAAQTLQDQSNADAQEQATRRAYLASLLNKLDPSQVPAFMAQNKDAFSGISFDPSQIPQTADQLFHAKVTADQSNLYPNLPLSTRQTGTYQAATGAALPPEQVKLLASNDVYSNPQQFDPQMQTRQVIEDKAAPTGGEVLSVGETSRHNKTEESQTGPLRAAQTGEAQAKTTQSVAETGKIGEETNGLRETNALLTGARNPVAGNDATPTGSLQGLSPLSRALVLRQADPMLLRPLARTPQGLAQLDALEKQIQSVDPQFSMADYSANMQAKKAFTSGTQAQNITAINTAIRHLNSLHDDFSALGNRSVPMWNTVANTVLQNVGGEDTQKNWAKVQKDSTAVANELNRAFRGSSNLSEKDTTEWLKGISPNAAPAQMAGSIEAAVSLLAGRNAELTDSYRRAAGPYSNMTFIGPQAQQILKKLGLQDKFSASDFSSGAQSPVTQSQPQAGARQLDAGTAQQYLQKAGGDKNKARQLAKADGWSF